jgi:hypothetical protein
LVVGSKTKGKKQKLMGTLLEAVIIVLLIVLFVFLSMYAALVIGGVANGHDLLTSAIWPIFVFTGIGPM